MAVSMQTPIPGYGNFGAVISGNIQARKQRESTELMQLRDLNEKARQFDNQLELNTKIFEVDAQVRLENLDAQMDKYWNYQEDMNALNLTNETENYLDRKRIDEEQKLIANNLVKNYNTFETEVNNLKNLYTKEWNETSNTPHDPAGWKFGDALQWVQDIKYDIGMPGLGLSTEEIKERNLSKIDEKFENDLQELYNRYGINIDANISFDPNNPDAATIINAPQLKDLVGNPEFSGPKLAEAYNSGDLHASTANAINTWGNQKIKDPALSITSLSELIQTNTNTPNSELLSSYVNAAVQGNTMSQIQPNYVNIPYQSSMPQRGY